MSECKHPVRTHKSDGSVYCKICCTIIEDTDDFKREGFPNVVLGSHSSTFDKMKYYGVKDARTGEGITKDTDVRDPVGITKASKKHSRGKK